MSGFHYIEFEKTGSILLNAEEKDELFGYIDRLKAENEKLRELVRGLVYATHPADRARLIADAAELVGELGVDA